MNNQAFMHGFMKEAESAFERVKEPHAKFFHGSPKRLKNLKARPGCQGIFLSQYPGIASLFVPSKKDIPGLGEYSSINFGYEEWGKRKQDRPHDKITITHNAKDLPKLSGVSKGYIYTVAVDRDDLEKFKDNTGSSDLEMVHPARKLQTIARKPHTVRWTTKYDPGHARRHGPAEKRAALMVRPSKIHGEGLFTTKKLNAGENVGLGLTQVSSTGNLNDDYSQTPHAKKVNHAKHPNIKLVRKGNKLFMVTSKPVQPGEELTSDYGRLSIQVADDFLKER